jgi:cell division protein FtsZ
VARELGILTVGVVTKPFSLMEGAKRMKNAEAGIAEFGKHVDSLIVILNDKLEEVLGEDATFDECLRAADDVLKNAVAGIAEIISVSGNINVDFEDVKTVMGETGRAMMGAGRASGENRAKVAAEQAVASPLLEGVNLANAKGVLVNISASRGTLKSKEVKEVMAEIRAFAAEDAHIIMGQAFDERLGDELRVTVVATGLGKTQGLKVINTHQVELRATGTNDAVAFESPMADDQGIGAAVRSNRDTRRATLDAMTSSGMAHLDIPAFLRRQAD